MLLFKRIDLPVVGEKALGALCCLDVLVGDCEADSQVIEPCCEAPPWTFADLVFDSIE